MTNSASVRPQLDHAITDEQKEIIVSALKSEEIAAYYRKNSAYAGATFTSIQPNDPYDITAADLHAVSMLSVNIGPEATRRLIDPGPHRDAVLAALARVPVDVRLDEADSSTFDRAWNLQVAIKAALAPSGSTQSNKWVTASKLSARKRPQLIPVRDNVVTQAFGETTWKSAYSYWSLIAAALQNGEVKAALVQCENRLDEAAAIPTTPHGQGVQGPIVREGNRLRLIDVALWVSHVRKDESSKAEADERDIPPSSDSEIDETQ